MNSVSDSPHAKEPDPPDVEGAAAASLRSKDASAVWRLTPVSQGVIEAFDHWVRLTPEAPAAYAGNAFTSYRSLSERSARLAHYLLSRGVAPGDRVGVCFRPHVDQLASMLAVWRVGAVYVPFDPTHPRALVAAMLDQAQPRLVLTDGAADDSLGQVSTARVDAIERVLAELPTEIFGARVDPKATSYLLFTSGTTGAPKGVLASHENLNHYLGVARQRFAFGRQDVFCSIARYTFSISLFELLSPLTCGGSVRLLTREEILEPSALRAALSKVTVLHAGPSLLSSLHRHVSQDHGAEQAFPQVRHASSGGDVVHPRVMENMKAMFPNAELFVIYGCTEVSCMACTFEVPREAIVPLSYVGGPFVDVDVELMTDDSEPTQNGDVGEIWVSGPGVVPGYLARPELDHSRFPMHLGKRFYRTGDLGRFSENGELEILGRKDFQIQVRGMRVELVGIENTIRELGLAETCAVTLKRISEQDERLVAYMVRPSSAAGYPPLEQVRKQLAERLPDYMVPQHLVYVAALPLTVNGKLDRRALQDLAFRTEHTVDDRNRPKSDMERKIAKAFCAVLNLEAVGLDDDFFDLGGHSLLAVLLSEQLETSLGMSVSPGTLFESKTVRSLSSYLQQGGGAVHRPIALTQGAEGPSLFLIAGFHPYSKLARRLEGRFTVYAVYAGEEFSLLGTQATAPRIKDMAAQYVELIRGCQPHGPYRLAGFSFGGILAYETAQQLREAGETVAAVTLMDAILPEYGLRGGLAKARRFVTMDLRNQARILGQKLGTLGPRRRARFGQHEDESLQKMELTREDAFRVACADYMSTMRAWKDEVTIVASGKRFERNPLEGAECGWNRHIARRTVHVLDCEHMEIFEEPWVDDLASIVIKSMEGAGPRKG